MKCKEQFFEILNNIFIGVKIEGNSGYINLMKIKNSYYSKFEEMLKKDIDNKLNEVGRSFEEELYNKLFTFFKEYFSESGSIYFSQIPLQDKVYERIYDNSKDVVLFWKTNMLYYVKTEQLFQDMEIKGERGFVYYFDVNEIEHKKNNEKKELIFDFIKTEVLYNDNRDKSGTKEEKKIYFSVKYSANGSKTKLEDIYKQIKKEDSFNFVSEKDIERAFNIFKRQSEIDYFINKNANKFLKDQFSFYIKDYLMEDTTIFDEKKVMQLRALQNIAFNIIDLVGEFEDELVKIWNKPKFAYNSNYVITIDKIGEKDIELLKKILNHNNIKDQIEEWKELGMVEGTFNLENIFDFGGLNNEFKYLPLDTKYIKDMELDILGLFDDLDNQLDGWLIHSENYQALNTIKDKFKEKVQTIYIDPPFNLDSSDQFDYRTNYKDSSWLSLLENRTIIAHTFLSNAGSFFGRCDVNGNYIFRHILNSIFRLENFRNEFIINTTQKFFEGSQRYNVASNSLFWFSKNTNSFNFVTQTLKRVELDWLEAHSGGERNPPERVFFGELIYPPKGRHWTFKQEKIDLLIKNNKIRWKNKEYIDVKGNKCNKIIEYEMSDEQFLNSNWTDIPGYTSTQGFLTENSEKLLQRVINTSSNKNELILDYFLGSGTTTAVAHKLKRKWIGIELANHFYSIILPRMKKVLHYDKSGISKDLKEYRGGGFFKYFSLEQYEETLAKVKYEDKDPIPNQNIYHQYIFMKDQKLLRDIINIDDKNNDIRIDLTKLHPNIDIHETLSHLIGKFIKQIKENEITFTDGTVIDLKNIDYKIIKSLIWW